ncbi:MAG TPA: cache and HAMP domain-containing protein, partial [Vicinamibacterales bacterium]|nr:cache and HAMP domain-containing protein [Vicinamibacterales bacterium]
MDFFSRQPIRRQLVGACVLVMATFVAAGAWSTMHTYAERESEVREQASEVAATAAAYFDEYFVSLDALASALVRNPSVVALNTEQSSPLFADLLRTQPLLINIVLTTPDGTARASGLRTNGSPIGPNRGTFREDVVRTGKPQVSDLLTGQISGKPTIVLAYPVSNADGHVAGILGLGVNLIQLQTVFGRIPLPEGSLLSLIDKQGRVLASNVDAERMIGTTVSLAPGAAGQQHDENGPDGIERVTANAVVSRGAWTLSVGIPTSVVLNRMSRLWFRNLAIAASLILSLLTLAIFVAWQTTLQLGRLQEAMQRIASGDLTPPTPRSMPNRELAQLQNGFISMAGNLQSLQKQVVRQ